MSFSFSRYSMVYEDGRLLFCQQPWPDETIYVRVS